MSYRVGVDLGSTAIKTVFVKDGSLVWFKAVPTAPVSYTHLDVYKRQAWGLGQDLGDQVISRFIEEEGHYPENIGIILWSGANMRSHGQCIAEFLYLLGVKPIWQPGSLRVTGLEVIPLEELKRPRIDVTARISGLFRDAMPCAAELLDKAVLKVGALEEDPELNFVRKHILEDSAELEKEEGMSKEEAWRTAAFRIFGDEQGLSLIHI